MKKNLPCSLLFVASFWLASITTVAATAEEEETPNWKEDTLTGDWGGARSGLYKKGIDIGIAHKSDMLSNVSGGLKQGTNWIGHSEARIKVDLEKLAGFGSTTAYFHYHSDLGGKFNKHYVGGVVGVDNIEVTANTAQFYHAWVQKGLFNDNLSILAGIYPVDSEFYVTDTTGLFLQPPYGMANEVANSGQVGPPVFPTGALAVRLKATTPKKNFYLMGALTDGVPGDSTDPHGTQVVLRKGDGTFSIVEFGYTPHDEPEPEASGKAKSEEPVEEEEFFNKTAIGFWRYTAKRPDLDTNITARHHSQGAYFLTEHTLFTEAKHPSNGLAGFFRFGVANGTSQQLDWTGSVGLRYHGLIPGREDDIAGITVTANHASNLYARVNDSNHLETDVEATYRAQIKPWLTFQPNLQFVANPGMNKALHDAWIIGFRTEVAF